MAHCSSGISSGYCRVINNPYQQLISPNDAIQKFYRVTTENTVLARYSSNPTTRETFLRRSFSLSHSNF
jgi:hypothetical protein